MGVKLGVSYLGRSRLKVSDNTVGNDVKKRTYDAGNERAANRIMMSFVNWTLLHVPLE
jgi:hypothetical protein